MITSRPSVLDKRRAFHALHKEGCFIIPNPWDSGSARYLESLGFKALATTSSGFAWSQARADYGLSRDTVLEHLARLVNATDLPVSADFENGFAVDADGVGDSVRLALETGISGLSIEDSTGRIDEPLFDIHTATARVRAARRAIDADGGTGLLVARTEQCFTARPDITQVIARLKAYAAAGADCLFAPGIRSVEDIAAVVAAVKPKPVNLLVGAPIGLDLSAIAALGVRRVSVGGALARAAWGGFIRAARGLADQGSFEGLADSASGESLNQLFAG